MPIWFYTDYLYIVLVLPAVIFSLIAQIAVKASFSKYSNYTTMRGITGEQAARAVLRANGVYNVNFEYVRGRLSDHYDPRTNTIRLSADVGSVNSIAAVGVAAHEAGHAVQYAKGYGPIKIRTAIIPMTRIGSALSMPLVLIGLVFNYIPLAMAGVIFFGLATVFQLVTLPVEFNASRRAMQALESENILNDDELKGARKTLTAAAMTYVAALFVSLMQFLRLFLLVSGRRRD